MSIFGFQFNMSSFVWPVFGLGIALSYMRKNSVRSFGEFVFGFAFMFLGLTTLRENAVAMDLSHNETIVNFFASMGHFQYTSVLVAGRHPHDVCAIVGGHYGDYAYFVQ